MGINCINRKKEPKIKSGKTGRISTNLREKRILATLTATYDTANGWQNTETK